MSRPLSSSRTHYYTNWEVCGTAQSGCLGLTYQKCVYILGFYYNKVGRRRGVRAGLMVWNGRLDGRNFHIFRDFETKPPYKPMSHKYMMLPLNVFLFDVTFRLISLLPSEVNSTFLTPSRSPINVCIGFIASAS